MIRTRIVGTVLLASAAGFGLVSCFRTRTWTALAAEVCGGTGLAFMSSPSPDDPDDPV